LSPFIAVGSILATRAFALTACLGLAVGFAAILRPRWLCRWVCPLGLCADGMSYAGRRCGRKPVKLPSIGRWIVLPTLAGACLGYPLLLWLDPLAIFSGAFGIAESRTGWLVVLPLLLVLALSFVWPHLWCSRICPLGALQDALTHLASCVRRKREQHSPQRWNVPLARRTVLGAAAGAALAGIARSSQGSRPRPLRPPGAIDEPEFLGVCVRCGNCIRACPTHIIEPSVDRHGPASLLTPIVHFREGYCLVDCTKCTQVCPSGALVRLSPDGKASRPIGLPQVDMSVCLLAESRECTECGRWCPHAAIRYAWSETEYTLIPEIDAQKCTGCGACEAACPTRPNKAIVVVAIENAAGG
jgi:MauM/NapG family ferredoxin protein